MTSINIDKLDLTQLCDIYIFFLMSNKREYGNLMY
jgi:hypothetical protein